MLGLMQDVPLTTNLIFDRALRYWGTRTITTQTAAGIERLSFTQFGQRTQQLAAALDELGLGADARIGSFAWNSERHLELYFAVPGTGRILHTINIRYFPEQILYSINHAEDEAIFIDRGLLGILSPLLSELRTVRDIVIMPDGTDGEIPNDSRVIEWADLVSGQDCIDFSDRVHDENRASALCYTTGTTGNPKGVLYSHRSTWLHAQAHLLSSTSRITDRDVVMPAVPMFHAMAWGMPYSSLLAGASLVFPGSDLSPGGLVELMGREKVTFSGGVPTIWMGMAPLLVGRDLSCLDRLMVGGSAVPPSLAREWEDRGVLVVQAWGMTESSPVGAMSTFRKEIDDATPAVQTATRDTAGMPMVGITARIVDEDTGQELPWDDESAGELQTRGPWVARQYYGTTHPGRQFTDDGWLRTGDVAAVSPLGYIRLVDRTKDLIKSGGEWISSIDLENQIMTHSAVLEAAVIAVPHPKWMERPLACVVVKPGHRISREEVLRHVEERVPKWQVPDDVVFLDKIPKTSVGKFSKKDLRENLANSVSVRAKFA